MGTVQTSNATGYEGNAKPALDQGHHGGHEIGFVHDARGEAGSAASRDDLVKKTGCALAVELHERLGGETFQPDDFLLCERVFGGQGNGQLVVVNLFLLEFRAAVGRKRSRKSQINAALIKRGKLLARVQLKEAQFNVGKFEAIGVHQGRQNRARGCPEKTNAQDAHLAAGRSLRKPLGFGGTAEDFLGLPQESSSCGGQLDSAFGAEQQFYTEFVFEIEDSLGDCGLGHVQATRRFAVVQILSNGRKVTKMAEFHWWRKLIAKYDYYKHIIRFLRLENSCDRGSVNGMEPENRKKERN